MGMRAPGNKAVKIPQKMKLIMNTIIDFLIDFHVITPPSKPLLSIPNAVPIPLNTDQVVGSVIRSEELSEERVIRREELSALRNY